MSSAGAPPVGTHRPAVEIAVQDAMGARVALAVQADRVELCSALAATGGLTPSLGVLEAVVAVGLPVHVLVRPRTGGFVHDGDELATMLRDVRVCVGAGAAGVVVGALAEGLAGLVVDRAALDQLIEAAGPAEVTFHRAVDVLTSPAGAIDQLVEAGVCRVLTSGGADRGVDGLDVLRDMVSRAAGRLEVMAGGGVAAPDVPALLGAGVQAVHLSARRSVDGGPNGPGGGAAGREVTDEALAAAVVRAAWSFGA